MFYISLIGIGPGGLTHITQAAKDELSQSELVLIPNKGEGKLELSNIRQTICSDFKDINFVEFDIPKRKNSEEYVSDVNEWHDSIARKWEDILVAHLPDGGRVSFLIWGDPSLYDSSIRISNRLHNRNVPISIKVIPGITSLQALTASHGITLNELAEPVLITTGRKLREDGWPQNINVVAVLLDGECSFRAIDYGSIKIWWGAYVGMEKEYLISGDLAEVSDEIIKCRSELKNKYGWIMDIYLLKSSIEAEDV